MRSVCHNNQNRFRNRPKNWWFCVEQSEIRHFVNQNRKIAEILHAGIAQWIVRFKIDKFTAAKYCENETCLSQSESLQSKWHLYKQKCGWFWSRWHIGSIGVISMCHPLRERERDIYFTVEIKFKQLCLFRVLTFLWLKVSKEAISLVAQKPAVDHDRAVNQAGALLFRSSTKNHVSILVICGPFFHSSNGQFSRSKEE